MPQTDLSNEAVSDKLVSSIADDRRHGASELARRALSCLSEFPVLSSETDPDRLVRELLLLAGRLQDARPSMVVIHNLIEQWLSGMAREKKDSRDAVTLAARRNSEILIKHSRSAVAQAAANATELVTPGQCVMTHSYSSSIRHFFQQMSARNITAIVTESQPGCEGQRLAKELSGLSITTSYITDAQIGLFTAKADFVLVGADTLLADGSVVNKSGTYPLALAARDTGTPFFVCCESFKQSRLGADQIILESMDTAEIALGDLPKVDKHNIYFDITPAYLVTGWINEQGIQDYD